MRKTVISSILVITVLFLSACMPVQAQAVMQEDALEAKIQDAMSAAPEAISKDATILDNPSEPGGEMALLREGTNGWTCIPSQEDRPADVARPRCVDDVWLAVMKAQLAKQEAPPITVPGIAYMLAGGGGPSISDPFATEPPPGVDWGRGGPHVMIITPGDLSTYSQVPGPVPWVMYPDTSYAHLMVAVPMPEK